MKKFNIIIAILAGAALCGCNNFDEPVVPAVTKNKVTLTVNAGSVTRTQLSEKDGSTYEMMWEPTDEIAIVEVGDKTQSAKGSIPEFVSGRSVSFTAQLDDEESASGFRYAAVYPYSAFTDNGGTYSVNLNSVQTPKEDGPDPATSLMFATISEDNYDGRPESLTLHFQHLVAYLKLSIKNLKRVEGDDSPVVAVSFIANDNTKGLAGTYNNYDPKTFGTDPDNIPQPKNKVSTVTAKVRKTGNDFDVWFTTARVNKLGDDGFTIKVATEKYIYTKSVAYNGRLMPGTVSRATIDMTDCEAGNDYYENGVAVNGEIYSKDSSGASVKHSSVESELTIAAGQGGVIFLDNDSDDKAFAASPTAALGIPKDIVIIGKNSDKKAKLEFVYQWQVRNRTGKVMFKNLIVDLTTLFPGDETKGAVGYAFGLQANEANSQAPAGLKDFVFEDCEILVTKPLLSGFMSGNTVYETPFIENIIFRNCKINIQASGNYTFIITQTQIDSGLDNFKTLVFENNVIYATADAGLNAATLFTQNSSPKNGSLKNLYITCKNNTFVRVGGYGTGSAPSYFDAGELGGLDFSKNLIYLDREGQYYNIVSVRTDYNDIGWERFNITKSDNVATGGFQGIKFFHDNTNSGYYYPTSVESNDRTIYKSSTDPFAGGTFNDEEGIYIPSDEYSGFGAKLE